MFIVKEQKSEGEPNFVTPNADYSFRAGDTLLVGGTEKNVEALKKRT